VAEWSFFAFLAFVVVGLDAFKARDFAALAQRNLSIGMRQSVIEFSE